MAPAQTTEGRCRNPELVRGVRRFSRLQMCLKRGKWAIRAKHGGVFPKHEPKPKPAAPVAKPPKFYPADDVRLPIPKKHRPRPTKLRARITPGTILILLSGRFMGKRVVFLKQLPSGLLMITGPYLVNGVPLRRVNQRYVIATSTKLDVSGANLEKFDDHYFAKKIEKKKKKTEEEFFKDEKQSNEKKSIPPERKEDQKSVDRPIIKSIDGIENMRAYLAYLFSLKDGMKPHELVF